MPKFTVDYPKKVELEAVDAIAALKALEAAIAFGESLGCATGPLFDVIQDRGAHRHDHERDHQFDWDRKNIAHFWPALVCAALVNGK
jgi:hypothetical protein